MIAVNSAATVTCPLTFLDWGTVETVMAGTVGNAETVQNSGWC